MDLPLRTEIDSKAKSFSIGLDDSILTLGSCFAQTMGDRFKQNKFSTMINPFGTVYHPLAIHKLIRYAALGQFPEADTYVSNESLYFNYDFHSSFVDSNKDRLQANIENTIGLVNHFLLTCRILVLTYGTAFIYDRKDNGSPVANCHKIPSSNFSKRLSSPEEITTSFLETMSILRSVNPSLRVILTISPVRHTRDTLELNSVSKSILRLACHRMVSQEKMTDYFPSYEIMMDDLRDYRFYKADLIHPTEVAEEYIWRQFANCYFDTSTKQLLQKWNGIQKDLMHKPFQPDSENHQRFLQQLLTNLENIKSEIDVTADIALVKSQLKTN